MEGLRVGSRGRGREEERGSSQYCTSQENVDLLEKNLKNNDK